MIANDDIPQDEMQLAESIAAAKARGLGWCDGQRFYPEAHDPDSATRCCAMGALQLAGHIGDATPLHLYDVWRGNDDVADGRWTVGDEDKGESLGWAYRCAMLEERE